MKKARISLSDIEEFEGRDAMFKLKYLLENEDDLRQNYREQYPEALRQLVFKMRGRKK